MVAGSPGLLAVGPHRRVEAALPSLEQRTVQRLQLESLRRRRQPREALRLQHTQCSASSSHMATGVRYYCIHIATGVCYYMVARLQHAVQRLELLSRRLGHLDVEDLVLHAVHGHAVLLHPPPHPPPQHRLCICDLRQ